MIYTKKDIQQEFTRLTQVMINHGCMVNPWTMHGSQSEEIAKIDFVRNNHIERLIFSKVYEDIFNHIGVSERIYRIELLAFKVNPDDAMDTNMILWNHEGEVLLRFNFIPIGDDRYIFMDDRMYQDALKTKKGRRDPKWSIGSKKLDSKYYPIFCRIIRKLGVTGFIRINPEKIRSITENTRRDGTKEFHVNVKGTIFIFDQVGRYIRHY